MALHFQRCTRPSGHAGGPIYSTQNKSLGRASLREVECPVSKTRVSAEIEELSSLWKIPSPQALLEGNSIHVSSNGSLHIGVARLQEILKQVRTEDHQNILRFIVAHEVWHRWQLLSYGVNLTLLGIEERQVLECQADAMALNRVALADRGLLSGDKLKSIAELLATLAQHSSPWHLSKSDRLTSLGISIARGLFDVGTARNDSPHAAKHLQVFVEPRKGESTAEWTLRYCKKSLRFGGWALAAISVDDSDVQVSGDGSNSVVSYRIDYRNEGEVPVLLQGTIGEAPLLTLPHPETSPPHHKHFEVRIPALRTATLRGEVRWPNVTRRKFESHVDPQSNDSGRMLTASYIQGDECQPPRGNFKGRGFQISTAVWNIRKRPHKPFRLLLKRLGSPKTTIRSFLSI